MKDALVTLVALGHLTGEEADGVWGAVKSLPPSLHPSVEARMLSEIVAKIKAERPL